MLPFPGRAESRAAEYMKIVFSGLFVPDKRGEQLIQARRTNTRYQIAHINHDKGLNHLSDIVFFSPFFGQDYSE